MGNSSQNFMLKLKIFERRQKPKDGKIYSVVTDTSAKERIKVSEGRVKDL